MVNTATEIADQNKGSQKEQTLAHYHFSSYLLRLIGQANRTTLEDIVKVTWSVQD